MADEIVPPATQLAAVSLENDGSTVQRAQFSNRVLIRTILDRPDGGAGLAGQTVRIGGWVKSGRDQGKRTFSFLAVNDGSCPANLQVMVDPSLYDVSNLVATGTCVTVDGVLKVPPKGKGTQQQIELNVVKVIDVGTVDASKYPLPKTKLTLETLRDVLHLRSRTNSVLLLISFTELCFDCS